MWRRRPRSWEISVDAVHADEGVEEKESRTDRAKCGVEAEEVVVEVEAERRRGDDEEVEVVEVDFALTTDGCDAGAHVGEGVLGEIDEGGSGACDVEASEAGGCGRDGDGHVESEPARTALGWAADEADGLVAP